MNAITAIITAVVTPLIKFVTDKYLNDAIKPITDKIISVENGFSDANNEFKHQAVLRFIKSNKKIMEFVTKCGWTSSDLDVLVSFCVLMAKKPPTDHENINKWNYDDTKIIFETFRIIASKWFKAIK